MSSYYQEYCEAESLDSVPVLAPEQYHAGRVSEAMQYAAEHPEKRFTIYQALSTTKLAIIDFPGVTAPQLSAEQQRMVDVAPDLALRDALLSNNFELAGYVLTRGADLVNVMPSIRKHFNHMVPDNIREFCMTHRACALDVHAIKYSNEGCFASITTMRNVDDMVTYILNDITQFYPRLSGGTAMLLDSVADYEKIIIAIKQAGVTPITAYQLHLMAF